MNVTINGEAADITTESEKTLGDFLTGMELWLEGAGHRLRGLCLDGEDIDADTLAGTMERDLREIKNIALKTASWPELAAEAVFYTLEDITARENASAGDKDLIRRSWKESPAARFLEEQIPDIFTAAEGALTGEGLAPAEAKRLMEERLRELEDPRAELGSIEPLVTAIAARLEDLPLDIQTGKDGRAAETVQLFSHVAEKLFRLLYSLKSGGFAADTWTIQSLSMNDFIEEFNIALRELTAAYEAKDAVLVGDLAEYELAPRLVSLYRTLKEPVITEE
jgi:hypothetical protein